MTHRTYPTTRSVLTKLLCIPIIASALAACGGGGGADPDLPDFPVDSVSARTLFDDSLELRWSSSHIETAFGDTVDRSDTLLVSDLWAVVVDVGILLPIRGSCRGDSCTYRVGGESVEVSLSDFERFDQYEPVMRYRDISLAQGRAADEDLFTVGYGGWLDHSGFMVEAASDGERVAIVYGLSIGDDTGTNPTSGTATWSGVMVGADVSASRTLGNVIQGDADIAVDFDDVDVDVFFTNIHDLDTGRTRSDMKWKNIPMADGAFQTGSGGNQIEGRFYGPEHEEVGGIFERDAIVGAFGARRD